jgi:hypothetical protein
LHKSIIVVVYQYIAVDRSLAKVGVEGSNPFARSNDFNALGDRAFAAQSGLAACVFISVLIGTPVQKSCKFSI